MYGESQLMQTIQMHYKKKEDNDFQDICITLHMSQFMRLWYLSHRPPAKAQASLRIHAVSTAPSLFAHIKYESRRRVRPKSDI